MRNEQTAAQNAFLFKSFILYHTFSLQSIVILFDSFTHDLKSTPKIIAQNNAKRTNDQ